MTQNHQDNNTRQNGYAAFGFADFRLLIIGRFIASLGNQMLSVAISWELWLRTHDALMLGLIGLAQVTPVLLLSLFAGHVADQYNRKKIVFLTQILFALCSLGLAVLSFTQGPLLLIYLCLIGIGISRAFNDPATSTLLPQTVPPSIFASAAAWSSSSWQLAAILGPALAGVIIAVVKQPAVIYILDAGAAIVFLLLVALIKGRPLALSAKTATLESLAEGFRFISKTRIILAAITLDMFAVLLGGAVALLPVYATDILKVDAFGLGLMRAAPSIGAIIMAVMMAHFPLLKQAGKTLLLAVAGFGVATVIFGLSTSFWLSIAMLLLLGGLDNISVVIRSTLLLVLTPDEMRGRISSVNSIFIGASNELGGFESGLMATLFGPVIAVVSGGIGTVFVVLAVAKFWPEIRNLKTLEHPKQ